MYLYVVKGDPCFLSQALRGKPTPVWPIKQSQKPQGLFVCVLHVHVHVSGKMSAHETQTMFVYIESGYGLQ